MNTIRDECFDKALDLKQFSAYTEMNSYLLAIKFTSFVINQFVDIGDLVVNSCHTEGYAFLAMHYRNKLVQCKNNFLANKSAENAWEFYETYIMLWKLRVAGEEKYLAMNKLEGGKTVDNLSQWATGGTLAGLISDICGYKDKEEAVKDNLKLLESYAFKYAPKESSNDLMYRSKAVIECPVDVEILSADGTLIYTLDDKEEISVSNDYGKFVSFYRATTGDYVKIAYFNNADSLKINAKGTENGDVSYTYVETEDHETYEVKGFNNVLVDTGSSIYIETDNDTYKIDQNADGVIDIEGKQADKKQIFVQFDYQDAQSIKIVYVNGSGKVLLPDVVKIDGKKFAGWYTEPNGGGEEFTSDTIVKTSTTVYAKWEDELRLEPPVSSIADNSVVAKGTEIILTCSDKDAKIFYTLDGTEPTKDSNEYKMPIVISEDVVIRAVAIKEGYKDSAIVVYNYKVEEDIEEPNPGENANLYTVTFNTGSHGTAPTPYTEIKEGSTIIEPSIPIAEGYIFTGWYKEENCKNKWNFDTDTVNSNITLYAGWKLDIGFGDILPEDIPNTGEIPDGLWIAGIADYIYTGQAIKPQVRVYDGSSLLKQGQDYTITYKNNIKANDASYSSTAPKVVIKGKGSYTGTETATFAILPINLNDTDVIIEDITEPYNNKVYKTVPTVTYNGKKLSNNKDFTVSYPDFDKKVTEAYCAVGTYDILLTGKEGGNYTGTRTVKFTITKKNLLSKAAVKKIPNQYYTGDAIEPEPIVTMKNTELIKDTDYTVSYLNNKQAGTATVILTGIGEYAGTKKATFKINGTPLKKVTISGIANKIYDGSDQKQDILLTINGDELCEGEDYEVTYSNNTNAGKAVITIKGINAYTGTIQKTFKIEAYDLECDPGNKIRGLQSGITCKYLKGGSKPKVELTFAGKKLIEGTDYTVSYKNNKTCTTDKASKYPTVTVKGKGNFKGTFAKTYNITSKPLNDTEFPVRMNVPDKVFINRGGNFISKPILTDADGQRLTAGKDYESEVIYTLENGKLLTSGDWVDVGTIIKAKVMGKGAYTGELEAFFRIREEDFSKAKVSIAPQSYTGSEITLNEDDISVILKGSTLDYGRDYEIIKDSYVNNVKKGTAEVMIAGKGSYGGTKIVKFKITSKRFEWFWRIFR